jgi:hypothetical protein
VIAHLNEAALAVLLESPAGPVGRDLEARAMNITEAARANARAIMWKTNVVMEDVVDYTISSDADGLFAAIGVVGQGRWSRYLSQKAEREEIGGWLTSALEAGSIPPGLRL